MSTSHENICKIGKLKLEFGQTWRFGDECNNPSSNFVHTHVDVYDKIEGKSNLYS